MTAPKRKAAAKRKPVPITPETAYYRRELAKKERHRAIDAAERSLIAAALKLADIWDREIDNYSGCLINIGPEWGPLLRAAKAYRKAVSS